MSHSILWNYEESVTDYGVDVPAWMDDVSPYDVAGILEGGCASGSYMPAVTYHIARDTMAEHGDDVLEYIESVYGELPAVPKGMSWSQMASFYLACAVELWASSIEDELTATLEEMEDGE